MALMTPEQFEESLKAIKPRVFMNGKQVENILENRNTRTVIEANKASYEWALDPRYKDIMTCYSPLIDDVVNRYTYVSASNEDLEKKAIRIFANRREKEILLRADKDVPYGFVIKVVSRIKKAGIEKLGMVTEPLD